MLKNINNKKGEAQTRCLPPAPWDRHPLRHSVTVNYPVGVEEYASITPV